MEALPAGQYTQIWIDLTVNHADKNRSRKGFTMHFAILFSPSTLDMLVAKTLLSILGKGEKAAENLAKVTDVSPKAFGRPGC